MPEETDSNHTSSGAQTSSPSLLALIGKMAQPYFKRENAGEIALIIAANLLPPILSWMIASSYVRSHDEEKNEEQDMLGVFVLATLPLVAATVKRTANSWGKESLKHHVNERLVDSLGEEKMAMLITHASQEKLPSWHEALMEHSTIFANNAVPLTIGMAGSVVELAALSKTAYDTVGIKAFITALSLFWAMAESVKKLSNMSREVGKKYSDARTETKRTILHLEGKESTVAALEIAPYERKKIIALIKEQEPSFRASGIQFCQSGVSGMTAQLYPLFLKELGYRYLPEATKTGIDAFSFQAAQSVAPMRETLNLMTKGRNEFEESMRSIWRMLCAIDEVHAFQKSSPLTIRYNYGDCFKVEKFSLSKTPEYPEGKAPPLQDKVHHALRDETLSVLKYADIELQPGIYKLDGKSGSGKSTLLNAWTGAWPYASGTVCFPCGKKETYFMPQTPFIPYKASLIGSHGLS
jgi:ABC-type multidrug transport system fused ATPase/permease subunit